MDSSWYTLKVEQKHFGDQCTTKLFVGDNEIYSKTHARGTYSDENTYVYATGYYKSATGSVKNIRFLWLWIIALDDDLFCTQIFSKINLCIFKYNSLNRLINIGFSEWFDDIWFE